MSSASLVLPHLLPHHSCLGLRAPCLLSLWPAKAHLPQCLHLPLWPTKACLPQCLHLPWRQLEPQQWTMKLSLKSKNDIFEPSAFLKPDQHSYSEGGMSKLFCPPGQEVPKYLTSWDFASLAQSFAGLPYGDDSVLGPSMFKWLEKKNFSWAWLTHLSWGPEFSLHSSCTNNLSDHGWRFQRLKRLPSCMLVLKAVFTIHCWLFPNLFSALVPQKGKRKCSKWLMCTNY